MLLLASQIVRIHSLLLSDTPPTFRSALADTASACTSNGIGRHGTQPAPDMRRARCAMQRPNAFELHTAREAGDWLSGSTQHGCVCSTHLQYIKYSPADVHMGGKNQCTMCYLQYNHQARRYSRHVPATGGSTSHAVQYNHMAAHAAAHNA